jgi:hypothetical protein
MNSSSKQKTHYVLLRDDDTSALTPVACLEQLYRPFLDRGLPVNLATIPKVRADVLDPNGQSEGYLYEQAATAPLESPLGRNSQLVSYLKENPGYHVLQHGFDHSLFEFDSPSAAEIGRRLDEGTKLLLEAGLPKPKTFVAPYDRLSRAALREVARRFRIVSTGWFEWRRLPLAWLPRYALKKLRRQPHWRIDNTVLLSHPGCLLSYHRPYDTMLDTVKQAVLGQRVTVLVTHWWEYFRHRRPDEPFIQVLHNTAEWLASQSNVRVISFGALADGSVRPA